MNAGDLAGKRCLRLMSSSGQEIVGLGYSARPMAAVAGLNVFGARSGCVRGGSAEKVDGGSG
jgi:hypothetical protein